MSVLEVNNIVKKYDDFTAVNDVSFKVEQGNIYGILGPNGAGKTTTIRMIMNIIAPDSGSIKLFNQQMNDALKSKIGYLPEERGIYQKMKVIDVLVFLAELKGVTAADAKKKATEWLEKFQLTKNIDSKINELSKGMQQKIQIISTIMHNPELIILDEPFSGLDPVNINMVKNIMLDLQKEGKAIMFSTHQMDAAEKLCTEILMINKGNKVLDGKLSDILASYGKNSVQVEYKGNSQVFDDLKIVSKIDHYQNYVEVEMRDGYSASQLLKEIVDKVDISTMKSMKSSLNEIFISLAGGENNE
jgi:ABC-2 type transport system ATP-binding protein